MVTLVATLRADQALLDPVFDRLRQRVDERALPTAALAVGDADGLIRAAAFTNERRPVSVDSNFFLASVTKPVVATLLMQFVEEGRLGLEQPIADFEPRLHGGGKERITAWHVMTHTSGLIDIDPGVIARQRPSVARMTQMVVEAPLRFEPGTRWEYNSAAFYLLTLLVEKLTGEGYVHALDERLQRPLEMRATFDPRHADRPIVAVHGIGVDSFLTRFLVLRYMARVALPGGGLFGSLDDLAKFGAALLAPRVVDGMPRPLSAATIALMGEDHTHGLAGVDEGEERRVHHGLGWGKPTLMRTELTGSPRVISHGGASGTRLWVDPDAGLVFVFFTNRWAADRGIEAEALNGVYAALG